MRLPAALTGGGLAETHRVEPPAHALIPVWAARHKAARRQTNFGGGVKWYAPNNRWGLRGDYRFGITRSKDDAPEFFGRDTRYIHRFYGGVMVR
jgi:hypothetical protein